MMSSDYPKIINCSSVLGFMSPPYRGLYSATKYSLEALTDALRRENYNSKIKFVPIQPGPINTDIKKKSIKHFEKWIDWKKSIHQKTYENKVIKDYMIITIKILLIAMNYNLMKLQKY